MDGESAITWGQRHFGDLELGDARRSNRLPKLVDEMCKHPGGTLPDKFSNPANLRAFYRIMKAKATTHGTVLASHYRTTREMMVDNLEQGTTVLILHDATELDYTTLTTLESDLGQIGEGSHRGYICHNSLAVCADTRNTLGLTSQILHHRADVPENETLKESRERENRESRLWIRGAQASGTVPTGLVVDVSDSLSDTFEYMAFEITAGRHFVLRAKFDRKLVKPINGQAYLFEAVRSKKASLVWDVNMSSSTSHKARTATVSMSFARVVLAVPHAQKGEYAKEPLPMWVIRVWEPDPPVGAEALEWILLTNVETTTSDEARVHVRWYECRPIIEEFHKGMKTGCSIEDMQFTKIVRLEPAIGVLSALTTKLMQLRDAARVPDADTRPASDVVNMEYIDVLKLQYPQRLRGRVSIKQFYWHVARLGGHQNRKSDGFPGWLTLWRGWMKLESMTLGYRLAKRKMQKTCGLS
jgi:hypothetical protein